MGLNSIVETHRVIRLLTEYYFLILFESMLPATSKTYPDFVTLVTVKVYVPRVLDTVNFACPDELVVAFIVFVLPLGNVQRMAMFALETALPLPSLI